MRPLIASLGVFAFVAIAAIATGSTTTPSRAAAAVAIPYATADPGDSSRVVPAFGFGRFAPDDRIERRHPAIHGLLVPIEGGTLPTDAELLPNAPREFRAGWHEGIDFPATPGTPVRAVAAGTIVRIDREFTDWDRDSRDIALEEAIGLGYTPAATLDRIRGRQVWIDHGHGIVTRYAHLAAVADLAVGDAVGAGQVVGAVGSSGYPEGGPHLHLEVRVSSDYLGDGLAGDALLAAIAAAFD